MIYVDTSALAKLVVEEPESRAFVDFYQQRANTPWVSSSLLRVELVRGVMRRAPYLMPEAADVLAGISLVPVDEAIFEGAIGESDSRLRTLDAIHLATARILAPELEVFVSYDQRQLLAASSAGLTTHFPR